MASETNPHTENSFWNSCWNQVENSSCWKSCMSADWNPKNWDITSKKVAQIAAVVLALCIVIMVVSGLMLHYPQATGAFFTIFGIATLASLTAMVIGIVKYCQKMHPQTQIPVISKSSDNNPTTKPPEVIPQATAPEEESKK